MQRRGYKRETHYPAKRNVMLPADMDAALVAEADAAGRSVSSVLRDAITRGLPLVRDSGRKARRTRERNGGGS